MDDTSSVDSPMSSPASSTTASDRAPSASPSYNPGGSSFLRPGPSRRHYSSLSSGNVPKFFPSKSSYMTRARASAYNSKASSAASNAEDNKSLLHKLRMRETGRARSKLFKRLPGRLVFCLKDAVPMSAIEAGHIFLGFSKCGQFLLSYTQTSADIELVGDIHINYYYRLHWWLFVPPIMRKLPMLWLLCRLLQLWWLWQPW